MIETDKPDVEEIEVTREMAKAGAYALWPDGEIDESADELAVMTRVFRAMGAKPPHQEAEGKVCTA